MSISTIDMIVRPSEACWLCAPLREILPFGLIRLPGLDLAVAVEAVDLIVLDLVIPVGAAVVAGLTVLERDIPPDAGAAPADLTVLALEAGRPVGVLAPVGSGDMARLAVKVL